MPDNIYLGPIPKGLNTRDLAFNIDNNSFATLVNFFVWRGRAKRKRGTLTLGQLQRQISISATPNNYQYAQFALDGSGNGNFITALSLESTSSLTASTISIVVGANTYTDLNEDGTLQGTPAGSGTINYATGAFTIAGGGASNVTGTLSYFPGLPVMGLPDFSATTASNLFPLLLAFDTKYSYQVNQSSTLLFYDTNYYKGTNTPFTWSGGDYQQFWGTNYSGAFWATNNNPGFHFVNGSLISGSGTNMITFNFKSFGMNYTNLVIGDKLFFNEWDSDLVAFITDATQTNPVVLTAMNTFVIGQKIKITGVEGMTQLNQGIYTIMSVSPTTITIKVDGTEFDEYTKGGQITLVDQSETINGNVGTVSNIAGAAIGDYIVTFINPFSVAGHGIAQLLTNSIPNIDGIRWYDGDPTNATGIPTNSGLGWVNFAPPLTQYTVSINNLTADTYYLVGARIILPFKDRLLFFGPIIQSSSSAAIILQDTVLWSWNGTPYYTTLVPTMETTNIGAYYVDQVGKGGYLPAGIAQPIITAGYNEDALIIGFGGRGRKTRFVYTGNDLQPFLFFNINNEFASSSTFSSVVFDKGMMDIGTKGITITDQQSCVRIDEEIPDNVFQIQGLNNGFSRVNAIRDFNNEWIYFSYPVNISEWYFPTQTFLFNYIDNTWAILYENFTAHGYFRPQKNFTWATVPFATWAEWREPWNAGLTAADIPKTIAGNPQGYVLYVGEGTNEAPSGTISAITNNSGAAQITSYNHCVSNENPLIGQGDYIYIQGCLGTTSINNLVGRVVEIVDANNFVVDLVFPAGVYGGLGKFIRLSQPFLQTKQFNPYWQNGRQVRLSSQKYLLDSTANAQVTVNIYLSQDSNNSFNNPTVNVSPNSLIYSQLVYTCPESTNIGLTPANTNLQMPVALGSSQIWHRMNTSLIGDSVQIGVTLSDAQMKNITYATSEIVLSGMQLTVSPSNMLA